MGAIPIVVAVGGWITNLLTTGWNWWLFGGFATIVVLSSMLAVIAETRARHPTDIDRRSSQSASEEPPVWLDVPPRSRHFTGREALLARLQRPADDGNGTTVLVPDALYGLGGVGKTQLAIEYAHRLRDRFDFVAWVAAEQQALLRSAYLRLAAAMGIHESEDLERTVGLVLDGLRRGVPFRRWLVVFDNAEDPASLLAYMPEPLAPHSTGRILITSRDRTWTTVADTLEVDVLRRDESVTLIRQHNPGVSDEDAVRLAEQMGDLPLALEQASAWIEATGTTVPEYLELVAIRMHDLLRANRVADYPTSVAAAWGLALDRLAATDADAAYLLNLCAFLGPEPIARDLLTFGQDVDLPTTLRVLFGDPIRLGQALTQIGRLSLARLDSARRTIQLHRLVQAVLRARLCVEDQAILRYAAQDLLAAADASAPDPEQPDSWPLHAMITAHIRPAGCLESNRLQIQQLVNRQAYYLNVRGDHESGRQLAEEAWARLKEALGPDHEQTLSIAVWAASAALSLGDLTFSRAVLDDTLDRARNALGDLHPVTLRAANSYGWSLRVHGRYQQAYELDRVTLEQHRATFGADDLSTTRMANNLAVDLRYLGQFLYALDLDEDNIRRRQRTLGEGHWHTLFSQCTAAMDHYYLGRYQRASELLRDAVPKLAAHLGISHQHVLWPMRFEAVTASASGQAAEAAKLSRHALSCHLATLNEQHPARLAMMMTAANIRQLQDPPGALDAAQEVLRLHGKIHGDEHAATVAALINTAIIERRNRRYKHAAEHDGRAFDTSTRILGRDHWITLCAELGLGTDRGLAGEHALAIELTRDAFERSVATRGADHPHTVASAVNLLHDIESANPRDATQLRTKVIATVDVGKQQTGLLRRRASHGQRAECLVELPPY